MLQRLFIAMLVFCLAVPALTMPAGHALARSPDAQAQSVHDCHKPAKQAPGHDQGKSHDCIGCIARYDGVAGADTAQMAAEALPVAHFAVQLPQTRAGPDTPPPKS